MSLQSAVAKMHRLQRGDKEALDCTVRQVWSEVTNEQAFTKVFDRLVKNYDIISTQQGLPLQWLYIRHTLRDCHVAPRA